MMAMEEGTITSTVSSHMGLYINYINVHTSGLQKSCFFLKLMRTLFSLLYLTKEKPSITQSMISMWKFQMVLSQKAC